MNHTLLSLLIAKYVVNILNIPANINIQNGVVNTARVPYHPNHLILENSAIPIKSKIFTISKIRNKGKGTLNVISFNIKDNIVKIPLILSNNLFFITSPLF